MKPVKKVHYKLDPFHPKPHSILNVMTHLSNEKIQVWSLRQCFGSFILIGFSKGSRNNTNCSTIIVLINTKQNLLRKGILSVTRFELIQKSNPKCLWKTEMVSDRSEPTIKIELNEGDSLLFKTANLRAVEILEIMNNYVLPRVVAETKAAEPKAAAGGGKGKKGKK